MRISKFITKVFGHNNVSKTVKPSQPMGGIPYYDSKNVTREEFKEYVQYLAKNNINRTFYEPDKFVTEAERKVQKEKEESLKPFREFVHNLAENNINRTFYC